MTHLYKCIAITILAGNWQLAQAESSVSEHANSCTKSQIAAILAPVDKNNPTAMIDCSASLPQGSNITKPVYFKGARARNIVFDCNGGSINPGGNYRQDSVTFVSTRNQNQWQTPKNVTLRNCTIQGSLRIRGMASNGQGEILRISSLTPNHTEQAQNAAPSHIILDNLTIIGHGRAPLYLAPGANNIVLRNSHISGRSNAVAIYLDAESTQNTIENNIINTISGRELMALDGSAHNIIRNNQFTLTKQGGIFLYRNCGEGGTIRHQTPSFNQITNNSFNGLIDQKKPAIWLASRNGNSRYCAADDGYPFGSSASNLDYAQDNLVSDNQFNGNSLNNMIRDNGHRNRIRDNSLSH